jgi:HK97 gp10 family phage protein
MARGQRQAMVVHGLDELFEALGDQKAAVRKAQGPALRAAGAVVETEAKQLVPVDTGTLRDAIVVDAIRRGGVVVAVEVGPTIPPAFHAHLVEFGTDRGSPAQPFMRPAWDTRKKEALDAAKTILREAIRNGL